MTRLLSVTLIAMWFVAGSATADTKGAGDDAARTRVLFVVDEAVYPQIKDGLATYARHVQDMLPVDFKPLVAGFYQRWTRPRFARCSRRSSKPATCPLSALS